MLSQINLDQMMRELGINEPIKAMNGAGHLIGICNPPQGLHYVLFHKNREEVWDYYIDPNHGKKVIDPNNVQNTFAINFTGAGIWIPE